jgi:RNA methyltransferase, TrmH family
VGRGRSRAIIARVKDGALIPHFGRARRDAGLAVLEGFHPLKHALRFGAQIELTVTRERAALERLARRLAPDVATSMLEQVREVPDDIFGRLAPIPPATGVMALARRPHVDVPALLAASAPAPVVLLENPRDLGNMGACVRVAAAADVAGVLVVEGGHDAWHPDALRGAAGLHFALPVADIEGGLAGLERTDRPLLALDPDGEELRPHELDPRAILAFGTERDGLSDELLQRADGRVRIPMREGVSSLNLATSVAATLFAWRLA